MPEIKEDILATLAYFDLFKYPLTRVEIYSFLQHTYAPHDFDHALTLLCVHEKVYRFDELYTLTNDQSLTIRRYEGNKKAAALIRTAGKVCDFLIRFPYVRGIAISGSLSKNYADENSDIDLFIITAKNRLWIARSIMHAFKKLTFLLNMQDYFCMNYYIDEQQLEIKEKSTYTAIEVVTLIPLRGNSVFKHFCAANVWTERYLPNKTMDLSPLKKVGDSFFKRVLEGMLNNAIGDAIDTALMKLTAGRWQKKAMRRTLNAKGKVMGMDAGKHYAKPDPRNFHDTLLKQYDNKVAAILQETGRSLAG